MTTERLVGIVMVGVLLLWLYLTIDRSMADTSSGVSVRPPTTLDQSDVLFRARTLNYWMQIGDDGHLRLCNLARFAAYAHKGTTVDNNNIWDTSTLLLLCSQDAFTSDTTLPDSQGVAP